MVCRMLRSDWLIVRLAPKLEGAAALRAVAFATVAMGFGGSMTYGQTVGLTHDGPLIGNHAALGWGLFGLAIKGSLWIGFCGAYLGLGLGGGRYQRRDFIWLVLGQVALFHLGVGMLNEPYNPGQKELPLIYFSDDWRWEPGLELKPRRELWGGLMAALLGFLCFARFVRKDRLTFRMGLWGLLGGALGFPLGQSVQAFHAWKPEVFQSGLWVTLAPHINWWNMMETVFGAIAGALLAIGLLVNRRHIGKLSIDRAIPVGLEWGLLGIHIILLALVEFASIDAVDAIYDLGLMMGIIPILGIALGRLWPAAVAGPIILMPIAGKTVKYLVYGQEGAALGGGEWLIYFCLPLTSAIALAWWLIVRQAKLTAHTLIVPVLLFGAVVFFGLNYAFFNFPWPWSEWTSRTPNGIIFTICLGFILWGALIASPYPEDRDDQGNASSGDK